MKRLLLIVMVASVATTAWVAHGLRSAEADYVQAQRWQK